MPSTGVVSGPNGVVAGSVRIAATPWTRMRGLIGTAVLGPDEGLVLAPCRRVHTYGMRFPIDAVFCDRAGRVLHVETLAPRRVSRHVGGAWSCIELPAGRAAGAGIRPGTRLVVGRS
jgi:uncharacterized membrane protein (UPF0127 family)